MHTLLEEQESDFHKVAAYYAERASGGVGMIMTGGYSPNPEGASGPGCTGMYGDEDAGQHKVITRAVHTAAPDCKICMQILHAGRYAWHNDSVAPSPIKSRINPFAPNELSAEGIPGKEEFKETIRYYLSQIRLLHIGLQLNHTVSVEELAGRYDHVVLATGVRPRVPDITGVHHPSTISYMNAIPGNKPIGQKVAIIGAGGIGFDVAELITHSGQSSAESIDVFAREWGIDFNQHP